MPPPPLVFHNSPPPERYLSEDSQFIPAYVPGVRRLAQPIPIDPAVPPTTEPHSYSLGSQGSIMSDISDSLRPSPPPLTVTSDLPTPYTLRTPAGTTASDATIRPIITSPVSPSVDANMEDGDNGLVRVKSFPHTGDLLGSSNEASSSRRATPPRVETEDVVMDDAEDNVEEGPVLSSRSETGSQIEEEGTVRLGSSAPRGSLTRLLRDIGNPTASSSSSSQAPAYLQPLLQDRARVLGSRWSQTPQSTSTESSDGAGSHRAPFTRSLSDRSEGQSEISQYDFNELGPLPNSGHSVNDFRSFQYDPPHQPSTYAQPVSYSPRSSGGFMPGHWGEAYTSHAAPPPLNGEQQNDTEASRIAPPRLRRPASPTDFRTLPSPITHTQSGSPSSVESRLDTIEARLDRVRGRNQRSPPTPPMLAPMHAYEGLRNRSNASRPYDLASRSRPSSQIAEEGSRRSSYIRPSSVRPSWMTDLSSSTSATVPPPRPRPTASFGWESADINTSPYSRSFSNSDRPSPTLFRRPADEDENGRMTPVFRDDQGVRRENIRSRYLQARMNMLDNLRTGYTIRPYSSSPWTILPGQYRSDTTSRTQEDDNHAQHGSNPSVYNLPTFLGETPSSTRQIWNQYDEEDSDGGVPFFADIPHPSADIPHPGQSRPGNRRWMSFDEGERERSASRTRQGDHAANDNNGTGNHTDEQNSLNRDVNEVIGRRLSQPRARARATSITRRLRDPQGHHPNWEDTRLPDTSSSSASTPAPSRDRPIARSRIGNLFGELDDNSRGQPDNASRADVRDLRDPLYALFNQRERRIATNEFTAPDASGRVRESARFGSAAGEAELLFLERLRSSIPFQGDEGDIVRIGRNGPESLSMGLLEGIMDIGSPDSPFAMYQPLRRFGNGAEPFGNLKITNEMDEKEKMKIVRIVIRSVRTLPHSLRKKGAESTLKTIKYEEFGKEENQACVKGMEKDEYCSVCHDDYEAQSEITITPCKHMYHQGCLDTWLNTPNTSSCPMCRRDLAALSHLAKMVPTKTMEEALPLWMAVVS
ncbi:hypothetical protein L486_02722 [Kwoniella mangroviensis CBS 10435]|uniref:RING-type domain-containing protein n=1 Tax=Kwoniella mangroviensis CBS 10435 TaxID=1331196 RepID=A0A1B9IWZ9_9TREE|nr:hypothetical protein L486_02722 [Kwoniella mangroviensis CBS 10435]